MNTLNDYLKVINRFLKERPGFQLCNYSTRASYQSDWRTADKQRTEARQAWNALNYDESAEFVEFIKQKSAQENSRYYFTFLEFEDPALLACNYYVFGYGPTEKFKRLTQAIKDFKEQKERAK